MSQGAHDWVDWLAALGPTLATVFAGVATIHVYLRGERFQRRLVRPLIAVRQQVQPTADDGLWRWRVQKRSVTKGEGTANIETLTVIAKEEIHFHEAMQAPDEYWSGVLYGLGGVFRIQRIKGHVISPPLSIGAGSQHLLFDALIVGQRSEINQIVRGLEIRGKCRSAFGELSSFGSRFGRNDRPD